MPYLRPRDWRCNELREPSFSYDLSLPTASGIANNANDANYQYAVIFLGLFYLFNLYLIYKKEYKNI